MSAFVYDWVINATAITRFDRNYVCNSTEDCTKPGYGDICLTGVCLSNYDVHLHDALSPAFEYYPYTGETFLVDESPEYPQWVEA